MVCYSPISDEITISWHRRLLPPPSSFLFFCSTASSMSMSTFVLGCAVLSWCKGRVAVACTINRSIKGTRCLSIPGHDGEVEEGDDEEEEPDQGFGVVAEMWGCNNNKNNNRRRVV